MFQTVSLRLFLSPHYVLHSRTQFKYKIILQIKLQTGNLSPEVAAKTNRCRFHQHFTRPLCSKKFQSQNVTREKLLEAQKIRE